MTSIARFARLRSSRPLPTPGSAPGPGTRPLAISTNVERAVAIECDVDDRRQSRQDTASG